MKTTAISTEGRVFVAQLTRDLAAREAAGAALLTPGTKHWGDAMQGFIKAIGDNARGPVNAAVMFKAGIARLRLAQAEHACFVNGHMTRSRSGGFELLAWEVAKHPLMRTGYDGVLVHAYVCSLQRNGRLRVGRARLAFLSWHALARIRERSSMDLFESRGVVAACGVAGLLLRESPKHANTGIYVAAEGALCAGVMRVEPKKHALLDITTTLPLNDNASEKQWAQGVAITWMVHDYLSSDSSDTQGHADHIEVLPWRHDDYVSRELQRAG